MTSFDSTDEIFQAVRDLIAELRGQGHHEAAHELSRGFGCLNGLTDGWALFLEAIERVKAADSKSFAPEHREALKAIRADVRAAVYRR